MKIRQTLALRFTLVSALIMGAILILVYILTRGFVQADFSERLTQHSRLEALHYVNATAREILPDETFLVNPNTSIYSVSGELLYSKGTYAVPPAWVTFMKENSVFNAVRGEYTTVGRTYDIDGSRYIVFVSDKDLPGQHELDILLKAILLGYFFSLVLSYFAGLYFSGNALQPVKHVVKEVNRITKDNLSYRLRPVKEEATGDEIDELVLTFNALLTRIESAFVAQKRLVQNASHELKTPLTAIMAEAELALARERPIDEYKRTLQVIVLETERLVRTTQGLLTLTRFEEGTHQSEMEEVDLEDLLKSTLSAFRLYHPDREVTVSCRTDEKVVRGNPQLLQTAILNMLDNAVKYSTGVITVSLSSDDRQVILGVQDTGIGIPAGDLSKVRSPLFRASNVGDVKGAGLGLALVDRIVAVHGGQFFLTSEEGRGTFCQISLPAVN